MVLLEGPYTTYGRSDPALQVLNDWVHWDTRLLLGASNILGHFWNRRFGSAKVTLDSFHGYTHLRECPLRVVLGSFRLKIS